MLPQNKGVTPQSLCGLLPFLCRKTTMANYLANVPLGVYDSMGRINAHRLFLAMTGQVPHEYVYQRVSITQLQTAFEIGFDG